MIYVMKSKENKPELGKYDKYIQTINQLQIPKVCWQEKNGIAYKVLNLSPLIF